MDYTKVPRELIYKERNDLKEFGVLLSDTMNYLLFMRLKQQALMGTSGAREVALRCYNNAYYVCTLILLEANDFPELRISDYVNTILEIEKDNKNVDETCLASMAMACLLLARFDSNKYGKDSEVWKAIYYRCTHYQWYNSSATDIFHAMMMLNYNLSSPLSPTEFAPRDIVEAIGDVNTSALALGFKYICDRLAGITNKQTASSGAVLAIKRLNDGLQELYDNYGYDPETKAFTPEMEEVIRYDTDGRNLFFQNIELREVALEYIIDHHPGKNAVAPQSTEPSTPAKSAPVVEQPEISETQQENEKLKAEVSSLQSKLREANHTIEELTQPVEELTAKDKIRMAFALQLLKEAGLTDETIKVRGNGAKVARIMSFLLEIISKNNRGNSAQICQTFLSNSGKYYPQTQDNNTLIELNTLCSELGINVCLSMESQSNNKR